ncbi:MAG: tetratricopeptide repeat protein [Thermodesulfobacteriota bacterium]
MKNGYEIFEQAERKRKNSLFLEALPLYIKAKKLLKNDPEALLACLMSLGDTSRLIGNFIPAERFYLEAKALAIKLRKNSIVTDSLVGIGLALRARGDHKGALKYINKALREFKKTKDAEGIAFATWALAGAYRIKGDIKGAVAGFIASEKLFSKLNDPSGIGYSLNGLGGASRCAGKYDVSLKCYRKANSIFTKLKDTFGTAYSHCGIANALRMKGRLEDAMKHFQNARIEYKKIGDKVSFAYTLWGEGMNYLMLKKNSIAIKNFKEAERFFKQTKDRRGLIYCALGFAQAEIKKNPSKATRILKEALKNGKKYGYGLEKKYCETVLNVAKKNPEKLPLNLA